MAKTIQLTQYLSGLLDSGRVEIGSLSTPADVSLASGLRYDKEFTVGIETTKKLFDASVEFATFELIAVQCDLDLMLEMVTDDGNEVGERAFTIGLRGSGVAGKFGMLFFLPKQISYANYTVNFAAGTLDLIEVLRVRNLSTTDSAKVRILAFQ